MKAEYEHIYFLSDQQSFLTKHVVKPTGRKYTQAWHYHKEVEICYTYRSHGQRFVGPIINNYQKGDIVIIGSQIPHGFVTNQHSEQFVLQFRPDFMGGQFLSAPELHDIKSLLHRAQHGLVVKGNTLKKAQKNIKNLVTKSGFEKWIAFIELLQLLATSDELDIICPSISTAQSNGNELNRVHTILNYLNENYRQKIEFETLANMVNLSKSAFCKFMKRHFHKTLTQLLTEIRLNHACQLLIHTDKSVQHICFESGFNDLSYFSRTFTKQLLCSPSQYRTLHHQ